MTPADPAASLIDSEEGPSSATVYDVDGLHHIGRAVCVDARVPGAGLPASILAALDAYKLEYAQSLAADLPGFQRCSAVRQAVLVSMCYQLGSLEQWPKFKAHLAASDYNGAADEMVASLWYSETPTRAKREVYMMRTGDWIDYGQEIPSTSEA